MRNMFKESQRKLWEKWENPFAEGIQRIVLLTDLIQDKTNHRIQGKAALVEEKLFRSL